MRGIVLGCGLWALDLRSGGFAMVVQPLRPTRCPGFLIGGVPERDRQTTPTSKQLARPLGRDVILGACRQHRLANWTIWW